MTSRRLASSWRSGWGSLLTTALPRAAWKPPPSCGRSAARCRSPPAALVAQAPAAPQAGTTSTVPAAVPATALVPRAGASGARTASQPRRARPDALRRPRRCRRRRAPVPAPPVPAPRPTVARPGGRVRRAGEHRQGALDESGRPTAGTGKSAIFLSVDREGHLGVTWGIPPQGLRRRDRRAGLSSSGRAAGGRSRPIEEAEERSSDAPVALELYRRVRELVILEDDRLQRSGQRDHASGVRGAPADEHGRADEFRRRELLAEPQLVRRAEVRRLVGDECRPERDFMTGIDASKGPPVGWKGRAGAPAAELHEKRMELAAPVGELVGRRSDLVPLGQRRCLRARRRRCDSVRACAGETVADR